MVCPSGSSSLPNRNRRGIWAAIIDVTGIGKIQYGTRGMYRLREGIMLLNHMTSGLFAITELSAPLGVMDLWPRFLKRWFRLLGVHPKNRAGCNSNGRPVEW